MQTRYCLNQETLSVSLPGSAKREFAYIPAGTVITLCGEANDKLVEVAWDNRTVLVFSEDIHERADQIFDVVEPPQDRFGVVRV
ncbi:MAG: hypothetical protein ACJ746_23475 [Bryobacteraceae bacterium]